MEENKLNKRSVVEKELKPMSGALGLLIGIALILVSIPLLILGIVSMAAVVSFGLVALLGIILVVASVVLMIGGIMVLCGLKIIPPNEALVLTLFGKYYGTIKSNGFFFVNPFTSAAAPAGVKVVPNQMGAIDKKISLKTMTLINEKQKVNDVLGNPIIIGANVIWRVVDPTAAVFNVENYKTFLSAQCDSIIRNVARMYPYDSMDEDTDEKTLRGSSQEIAELMETELQERVKEAGIEIQDVRITHLSYAEEIAAAMLQRQQAVAIIAARQKIVEGAVGMVKMAIDQLGEEEVVVLDEERKAAMVSNLLVVLCGNKDAQPIVNSGTIY